MQIQSEKTLPVIEHDEITFEIQRSRQQHRAVIHRINRSPAGNSKIQAQMWTGGFAIEDTPGAENVRNRSLHGRGKWSRPLALGSDPVQIFFLNLLAFLNLFLLLRARLGKFPLYAELRRNFGILAEGYRKLAGEWNFLARRLPGNSLSSQLKSVSSWSRFQADARQREPGLAVRVETE